MTMFFADHFGQRIDVFIFLLWDLYEFDLKVLTNALFDYTQILLHLFAFSLEVPIHMPNNDLRVITYNH